MAWSDIPIPHYFLMFFGWISFFLYITIDYIILRWRSKVPQFRSAFFTLLLSQSFAELLLFLHIELIMRPRKYGISPFFGNSSMIQSSWAQFLYFYQTLIKDVVVTGFIAFAVNRFTAICTPYYYGRIWTTGTVIFFVVFSWVLPLAAVLPIYYQPDANFSFIFDSKTRVLVFSAPQSQRENDAIMCACFSLLVIVVCGPLYVAAAIFARRRLRRTGAVLKIDEVMMLACSILSFTTIFFDVYRNVVHYLSQVNKDPDLNIFSLDLWYYSTEIMCILQPWIVVSTNIPVRKRFMALFRRKAQTSPGTTGTSTGPIRMTTPYLAG